MYTDRSPFHVRAHMEFSTLRGNFYFGRRGGKIYLDLFVVGSRITIHSLMSPNLLK